MTEEEQNSYISDLKKRDVIYFIGDDNKKLSKLSTQEAYEEALNALQKNALEDYSSETLSQEEAEIKFSADLSSVETKASKKTKAKKEKDLEIAE